MDFGDICDRSLQLSWRCEMSVPIFLIKTCQLSLLYSAGQRRVLGNRLLSEVIVTSRIAFLLRMSVCLADAILRLIL